MNKNWEVNVQELDYKELKKEEQKMNKFIKINLPVWRVELLTDSIRVKYDFEDEHICFYIKSKYAFLNRSKDDNYYFTISINPNFKYKYWVGDVNGYESTVELTGVEFDQQIKEWKKKSSK